MTFAKRCLAHLSRALEILAACVALGWLAPPAFADGTPWCITFGTSAASKTDADGGTMKVTVKLSNGRSVEASANFAGNVSAADVASTIAAALDLDQDLAVTVDPMEPRKIKIVPVGQLEITSLPLEEGTTGLPANSVKDDPGGIVVRVRVDISGTGVGRQDRGTGTAVLAIGEAGPLATVITDGKPGSQVEAELANAFNALYAPGYVAALVGGALVVENVPCELGSVFGSDDNGLAKLYDTVRTSALVPALSEIWMIAMVLVLMGSGALWLRRRRTIARRSGAA